MAQEMLKAQRRRWCEDAAGIFPWRTIMQGKIIDVGCGPCPVNLPDVTAFDTPQGDANRLSSYFAPKSFDCLVSSQSLEHMNNPAEALADWLKLLKRGGHAIVTIPCWELYEGMVWPSRYNFDHRSSWSLWQKDSPAPFHCKLPEWLEQFKRCEVVLCRLVDTNYDYKVGTKVDQTWEEKSMVEAFLEFVLRIK